MIKTNQSEKRIEWIDSCKGLAIILVVIGHIADGYLGAGMFPEYSSFMQCVLNLIYSFHMPLFFVLSGYVFYLAYCTEQTYKKGKVSIQIFNLVYIYIVMCCIQWIFKYIFSNNATHKLTIQDLILIPVKPIAPYWYLYVLIFYYLIFVCVERITIQENIKLIICFVVSAVGSCVKIEGAFPLYRIIMYSIFFYLGIFLAKDKNALEIIKRPFNLLRGAFVQE